MDLREVLAEKIRAAFVRGSARDLYDAWFLVRKGISIDSNLLTRKLKFYNIRTDISSIISELKRLQARWSSELRPVVFGEIPDFQEAFKVVKMALVAGV